MNRIIQILIMAIITSLSFSCMANDQNYGKQKVVYHVNYDNATKQSSALRNIQNHINAVGADNLDIRVVMHGNGLSMILKPEALKETPKFKSANADQVMSQKIDKLKLQGVSFKVCANTVKGRQVNIEKHLYDASNADTVPSGVAELAHLQGQGFSYLRP
ncbi:DsrE family protein [Thiomicrorhabdus lithotrophica]|uniref:DsrE family protein n=1 Tax=Thiomicrorhabdus lithotrophica TaxID=2949997 RepID=A0ABY8C9S6_9GAMM|nr:DsrE family protein [Thiomicrorhabdus lithotrophica]WEJ62724.1 DsrE family protein [Thiomicrorhabdus lithotrophica]